MSAPALLGVFAATVVYRLTLFAGPVLDPDLVGAVVYAGLGTGAAVVAFSLLSDGDVALYLAALLG